MSVATLATLICVGASLMLWRGTPSSATPTPTTYSDYTMYGENGVHIGVDSVVTGLVGARHNRTESPNPHESLHLNGGSEIHGDARMGEDVDMQNNTKITGALDYVGTLTKAASATIGTATQVLDAGLPVGSIPTQWPAPGAATYCATDHGNDINVANGQTITLTPGVSWGTIHAGSNTDLIFNGAGDYFIDSLNVGSVDLTLTPGMRVFVCNSFQLDGITSTPPASLTPSDVYVEVAAIPEDASHWGFVVQNGHWVGNVVVPTAGIHYGSGSSGNADIKGQLWAEHIDLEQRTVTVSTPTTTTTTTTSSVTSPSSTSTSTSYSTTSSTSTSTTTVTAPDTTTSTSTPTSSSSTSTSTSTSTTTVTVPETTSTSTSTSTSTTTVTAPDTTTTTISNETTTTVPNDTTTTVTTPDSTTTSVPDTTSTSIDNASTTTITAAGSTTTSLGGDTTTTSGSQDTTSTTSGGSGPLPFTGSAPFAEIVVGLSCLTAGGLLALRRRNAARDA